MRKKKGLESAQEEVLKRAEENSPFRTEKSEDISHPLQRQRKRKRRKNRIASAAICIIILGLLTASAYLITENTRLNNELQKTVEGDAKTEEIVLTGEEMQKELEKAVSQAAVQSREELLTEVKSFMESGEGTGPMLRTLFPKELVVASSGRYYFLPILETVKKHSYLEDHFKMNKEDRLEYIVEEEVQSVTGIDVSRYQEEIDWEKVAGDGIEYAFIRVGIRGTTEGGLIPDETFESNMEGAAEHGIDTGVYFFTQALNEEEAKEEARFVLESIEPYDLTYPIVLDVEEITTANARTSSMEKEDWTKVCIAFCEEIKAAGYIPMIYGNLKTFLLMVDMEQLESYDKWFAYYQQPLYFPYQFEIWQYTAKGSVAGIKGDVDLNISMKKYE